MNLDAIVKSGQATLLPAKQQWCLFNTALCPDFNPAMFNASYWQNNRAITGTAQGRGTTYFIEHADQHWVLRHYYRGGLIGKLLNDSYLFLGLTRTRAIREYLLLAQLQDWQLPAPAPIACKVEKSGLNYRADIITVRIGNANDLYTQLKTRSLSNAMWQKIGQTIASFHQKQVYHHDLNIHNILIDEQENVWLIDFDQGAIKQGHQWQQGNMDRLLRSFHKEKHKNSAMCWQESDWQPLLAGYQQALQK